MLWKYKKRSKIMGITFMSLGILSVIFGIVMVNILSDEEHALEMLAGMLTGAGTAFIALSGYGLLRMKFGSQERLEQEEIDFYDERNMSLMQRACTVAASAAVLIFALLSFLFIGTGYMFHGLMMIAAIYVILIVYLIAYKIFNKKM